MALTQVVDATRRLVINVATGTLYMEELRENQETLRSDPAFEGSFRSLVDLRRVVDIDISAEDMRALAHSSPFNPGIRRAYVVTFPCATGRHAALPGDHQRRPHHLQDLRELGRRHGVARCQRA
jgi:hypothetical protein